ncbi:GNAT family N-acetyltransferase [Pedobacter nototheniae]|uniref:GNAT family N-acetyltransferase n=1 Tax=Pedobacter nototheniae TaxID=2488994 RepID=UPI00292D5DE1|nr:GNAT family N-acetyltransferase [Pedobacter nototheniae]
MKINTLENIEIGRILDVLNLSFSDYIVPLQLNLEQLQFKILTENIKLDLSIGVFASGKLVGFMLHALNSLDGKIVAYNAATGVVPGYRGQGLVAKMYDYLLPRLKAFKVEQMVLEVIAGNNSAIRAYEKIGYNVHRTVNCFGGHIQTTGSKNVAVIKELNDFQWNTFTTFWSTQPTWQNSIKTVENSKRNCHVFGAYIKNEVVGYIVYNPTSRKILQIAVATEHRRKGIGSQLVNKMLEAINPKEILIYNIDNGLAEMTSFLERLGLSFRLAQFEMKREI